MRFIMKHIDKTLAIIAGVLVGLPCLLIIVGLLVRVLIDIWSPLL